MLDLGAAPAHLPLAAALVIDVPTATTVQCGGTTFGTCVTAHGGTVVRCH